MTINGLPCKLLEKKGKKAEVEVEGQILVIPANFLPSGIKNNEVFFVHFSDEKTAKAQEKKIAQAILEEILNGK